MMTAESIRKLLEVGYSLYRIQEELKKVFGPYCVYLEEEIEGILRVVMVCFGIEEQKETANAQFKKKFQGLCAGNTSMEELLSELMVCTQGFRNGQKDNGNQVELVNKLIDVVMVINHKRGLIKSVFRGENYFLNHEKETLKSIVLQELGDRRSFQLT